MIKHILGGVSGVALAFAITTAAQAAEFGSADEAKAMLYKAVAMADESLKQILKIINHQLPPQQQANLPQLRLRLLPLLRAQVKDLLIRQMAACVKPLHVAWAKACSQLLTSI